MKNLKESFFDLSMDMCCIATSNAYFSEINQAWTRTLGWSQQELTSRPFIEFIHPEDVAKTYKEVEKLLAGEPTINFENRYKDKQGEYHWLSWMAAWSSEHQVIFAVAKDITEKKKNEQLLEKQRAALFQKSRLSALGEMASGIAHEINNPLAIINGKIFLLRKMLQAKAPDMINVHQELGKIEETTFRISKIIKGLKSLSRSGEDDAFEWVSLTGVLDETLEMCTQKIQDLGIDLRIDIPAALKMRCKPVQLSQVFLNLLLNAIDAIKDSEEKWILIRGQFVGAAFRLSVIDSGRGIPAADQEKIMQPFFTTKPAGTSMGLGLSISASIIDCHQGQLSYDSASPHTCFHIQIPAVRVRQHGLGSLSDQPLIV